MKIFCRFIGCRETTVQKYSRHRFIKVNRRQMNSPSKDGFEKTLITILICEDLKSQKVFNHLRALGLEDTFYQCDLSEIVLKEVGLNTESEKNQYLYFRLVKELASRVTPNQQHLNELASELLFRLIEKKRN